MKLRRSKRIQSDEMLYYYNLYVPHYQDIVFKQNYKNSFHENYFTNGEYIVNTAFIKRRKILEVIKKLDSPLTDLFNFISDVSKKKEEAEILGEFVLGGDEGIFIHVFDRFNRKNYFFDSMYIDSVVSAASVDFSELKFFLSQSLDGVLIVMNQEHVFGLIMCIDFKREEEVWELYKDRIEFLYPEISRYILQ